jgi:hypothetical protein
MPGPTSRKPLRHRLRFSVRGLIIVVLLLGCGLGGMAHFIHQARVQRETIAAIERSGGFVDYDWQWRDGAPLRGKPWWPRWLEARVGIDGLSNVVHVSFDHLSDVSDVELELVGRLPRLEDLDACKSSVTDAGLAYLAGLRCLRHLDLSGTPVAGAGLAHLAGLKGLKDLDLSHTEITDAGLAHLGGLSCLQTLSLAFTDVGHAGVARLKKLRNLRSLDLAFTKVDDFAAQELRRALPRAKVAFTSIMAR